jgi:transcriptional regulator with XRE-family HTH domain
LILEEENLVKKTCKELGITQKELAEKIGVSQNTVSTWKNNNKIPNLAIKSL